MEPRTSANSQYSTSATQSPSKLPNRVVNDSAASRNSVVEIALSFSLLTGTSVNDLLTVSRKVPPGGYALVAAMFVCTFENLRISKEVLLRHEKLEVGQGIGANWRGHGRLAYAEWGKHGPGVSKQWPAGAVRQRSWLFQLFSLNTTLNKSWHSFLICSSNKKLLKYSIVLVHWILNRNILVFLVFPANGQVASGLCRSLHLFSCDFKATGANSKRQAENIYSSAATAAAFFFASEIFNRAKAISNSLFPYSIFFFAAIGGL